MCKTKHFFDNLSLFQIEKLRIGHDGRGSAADWYVEEVILNSAVQGEHLIFPCHAWVAEEHGVGSADKELYPKQPGKVFMYWLGMWSGCLQ